MTDDAVNDGWLRLLDELDAMAAELRGEGWETLAVAAGDTAAVTPGGTAAPDDTAASDDTATPPADTATPPADTAAGIPDDVADRHGYAYVVPGEEADRFEELFVPEGFPRTDVYRQTAAGHLYLLTASLDPPTERAILLAGLLAVGTLGECRRIARETGVMYSHVLRVDGTHVGSFEHDDPEPFFPGTAPDG